MRYGRLPASVEILRILNNRDPAFTPLREIDTEEDHLGDLGDLSEGITSTIDLGDLEEGVE